MDAAVATPAMDLPGAPPYGKLAGYIIERNYAALGCDRWNTARVRRLCAKLQEPPEVLAVRLRIRPADFSRRIETDCWTKQDGLILTIIEREADLLIGGRAPVGQFVTKT